jgi:hypothetical protein
VSNSFGPGLSDVFLTLNSFLIDRPNKDELNAALSGAIAKNLDHELDYLLERKQFFSNRFFFNF